MSLLDTLQPRDERRALGGDVRGVSTGVVTNNQDPSHLGRVKLRLPWLDDQSETEWVPVVTFMGGDQLGASFIPEVDDMVLVAFEHGDVNHPFVLGVVRTSREPPPYGNQDGGNHTRVLRSRSGHEIRFVDDAQGGQQKVIVTTQGGHELCLDDAEDSAKIRIKSRSGHEIVLDDSAGAAAVHVKDASGNELKLSAQDGVLLKGAARLSIQAPSIELQATASLSLNGQMVRLN